jgi:ankyrin repeat protein
MTGNSSRGQKGSTDTHSLTLLLKLPFIAYSLSYWLYHADAAEANNKPQDSIFHVFDVPTWINMTNVLKRLLQTNTGLRQDYLDEQSPDWSILYIIAKRNFSSLLLAWKRFEPTAKIDQGDPFSPIRAALESCNYDSLRVLMTRPWASAPTGYIPTDVELSRFMKTYQFAPEATRSARSASRLLFEWGSESEVLTLIRCGISTSEADESFTALHAPLVFAAERGYEDVVKYFLKCPGVDYNQQDYLGITPLMRAAGEGRLRIVSHLLQCNDVAVNMQCKSQRTALSYAAEKGHEATCGALLNHPRTQVNMPDNMGRTPFFYACMKGQDTIVEFFLNTPIFPNSQTVDVISKDNIGYTALSFAVLNGHEKIVSRLLRNKTVEINSRDNIHERTPLMIALEYRYYALAKLLLAEPNIDVSISKKHGKTALDYATESSIQREAPEMYGLIEAKMNGPESESEFPCDDG